MPVYEFSCAACEHVFETLVRGDEEPECPQCASKRLAKLLSVPAKSPESVPLPNACDSSLPPCSPTCCRLPR